MYFEPNTVEREVSETIATPNKLCVNYSISKCQCNITHEYLIVCCQQMSTLNHFTDLFLLDTYMTYGVVF